MRRETSVDGIIEIFFRLASDCLKQFYIIVTLQKRPKIDTLNFDRKKQEKKRREPSVDGISNIFKENYKFLRLSPSQTIISSSWWRGAAGYILNIKIWFSRGSTCLLGTFIRLLKLSIQDWCVYSKDIYTHTIRTKRNSE